MCEGSPRAFGSRWQVVSPDGVQNRAGWEEEGGLSEGWRPAGSWWHLGVAVTPPPGLLLPVQPTGARPPQRDPGERRSGAKGAVSQEGTAFRADSGFSLGLLAARLLAPPPTGPAPSVTGAVPVCGYDPCCWRPFGPVSTWLHHSVLSPPT